MQMKVILPSEMEAEHIAITADGQRVKIKEVIISPFYYTPEGRPSWLYLESLGGDKKVIQKSMLVLAGSTGKVGLVDRTKPIIPKYDRGPGGAKRGPKPKVKENTSG